MPSVCKDRLNDVPNSITRRVESGELRVNSFQFLSIVKFSKSPMFLEVFAILSTLHSPLSTHKNLLARYVLNRTRLAY